MDFLNLHPPNTKHPKQAWWEYNMVNYGYKLTRDCSIVMFKLGSPPCPQIIQCL